MINTLQFIEIINNTVKKINRFEKLLNRLNVFPVADCDTGTNIVHTLILGKDYINNLKHSSFKEITNGFANQLIRSSRGNSGLIFSQFFKGFDNAIPPNKESISLKDLLIGFKSGYHWVYNTLTDPKEGTILNVMQILAQWGNNRHSLSDDTQSNEFFARMYKEAVFSLVMGIDKLEILKQVGVVDSGGYAFLLFVEELYLVLSNESIEKKMRIIQEAHTKIKAYTPEFSKSYQIWQSQLNQQNISEMSESSLSAMTSSQGNLNYPYCMEFFIHKHKGLEDLKKYFEGKGDSLLIAEDETQYKIHIHTNKPEDILNHFYSVFQKQTIKIDNMNWAHRHYLNNINEDQSINYQEEKEIGVLAIAPGEGLAAVMYSLGIDRVLIYKDPFHLSIVDLLTHISAINAKNIILIEEKHLNEQIVSNLLHLSIKPIEFLPCHSYPEQIHALLVFNPELDLQQNIVRMKNALSNVISAEIIDAKVIENFPEVYSLSGKKNELHFLKSDECHSNNEMEQYVGIIKKDKWIYDHSLENITLRVIKSLIDNQSSLVTIFYGQKISSQLIISLRNQLIQLFPNHNFEFIDGKQNSPLFIVSLE